MNGINTMFTLENLSEGLLGNLIFERLAGVIYGAETEALAL